MYVQVIEDEMLYHYPLEQCNIVEVGKEINIYKEGKLIYYNSGNTLEQNIMFHGDHLAKMIAQDSNGVPFIKKGTLN
jgi:hypothetical protein